MSQHQLIHGFASGRSRNSLNLSADRLACSETFLGDMDVFAFERVAGRS